MRRRWPGAFSEVLVLAVRLDNVLARPTPGDPDDFPRLMAGIASGDPSQGLLPRGPHALGDPVEGRGRCSVGKARKPVEAPG